MYVIRRIAKAQPGKVWQVANLLIKICAAYEENGRPKAQVYVSQDLPGTPNVAYAEWTQATIEPNWPSLGPRGVLFGTPHPRAAGPAHPPRPYPGDERRELQAQAQPGERRSSSPGRIRQPISRARSRPHSPTQPAASLPL